MKEKLPSVFPRRTRPGWRSVWTACVLAGAAGLGAPATSSATEDNDAAWAIFTTSDAFETDDGKSRWRYWFDAQARYFDLGSGANQYLVRPGLGYDINDKLSAWAGYARLRARNASGNVTDEDRFWQQLSWSAGQWKDGNVSMRLRLEQRLLSSGDDVGLVLRLSAKYVRPIGRDGKTSFIVGVEPFFDLRDTDWGGKSGIGQNRTSLGVAWRASGKLMIETLYMNQFIWRDSGEDRSNHVAVINFKVKL